jgi:hypothetical protein
MVTNGKVCTPETKSSVSMAKAALDKKEAIFTRKFDFK